MSERLIEENKKLRKALAAVIPWVGQSAYGPAWATPDAQKRNIAMCDDALNKAFDCFPEGYDNFRELVESN